MGRYLPQLDGLRAIAVLLVIGTHTNYIPGGYVGPDIFFALSGYLITTILLRERAQGRWSIGRFYIRRARRLYPALLLLLVLALPFGSLIASSTGHYAATAAIAATYTSDFVLAQHPAFMRGLGHTWSLGVEEQFYLVWPFILLFSFRNLSRRATLTTTLSFAAMMLLLLSVNPREAPGTFLPFTSGGVLLLGCALALVLDGRTSQPPVWLGVLCGIGLVAAVILAADSPVGGLARTLAGIMACGVIAGTLHGGILAQALSSRPLVWLGQRSYGVYLWQTPIIYVLTDGHVLTYGNAAPSLRVLIPTLIGAIGLAAVSYRYIETRFRRAPMTGAATGLERLVNIKQAA
jgi:peptidoglycan/LPS O-acetylase OafA/YrhL